MIVTREVGMERRVAVRFPFKMRAYALDGERGTTFESEDISQSGIYLLGDPQVAVGEPLWLRLELDVVRDGKEWVYPVDAEVEVVRVTKGYGGQAVGFAARWVLVVSHADIEPIREFLRRILSVSAGFVQKVEPGTEMDKTSFVYAFSRPEPLEDVAPPALPGPPESASILEDPAAFLNGRKTSRQSVLTGIYVILPVVYRIDNDEYDGRAVKLKEHGMRIATNGYLPEVYRRIAVRIPIRHKDKTTLLDLIASVVTIRRGVGDGEGQFEVEFGLANAPDNLNMYRRILERLERALSESRGP